MLKIDWPYFYQRFSWTVDGHEVSATSGAILNDAAD